jgi:hypothetical protein
MIKEKKIQIHKLPKLSVCEILVINLLLQQFHVIQFFIYLQAILTAQ